MPTLNLALRSLLSGIGLMLMGVLPALGRDGVSLVPSLLRPLPDGVVLATSKGSVQGKAEDALFKNVGNSPLFSRLEGTRLDVTFPSAISLQRLAVLRIGWGDWSLPDMVSIALDGRVVGDFALSASPISPSKYISPEPYDVDVVDFGGQRMFSRLSILIKSASARNGKNPHGTIRLAIPVAPPLGFGLASKGPVPADSVGVEFTVESAAPVDSPRFIAKANQFRTGQSLEAILPRIPAGRSTHRVLWNEIQSDFNLPADISPLNFYEIAINDPAEKADWKIVSWHFLTDSSRRIKSAFDKVATRSWSPDAAGWRKGIPSEGFGRFGWLQNNGVLVGAFSPNSLSNTVVINTSGKPQQTASWAITCGDADILSWERTRARWTLAEHLALYDYSSEISNELAAKDPDFFKKKRLPQRILGSILAPGMLVDSQDNRLRLALKKSNGRKGQSKASILYPGKEGIRSQDISSALDGQVLSEGWFVVTWDEAFSSPVLVVPKRRPARISYSQESGELTLEFKGPLDRIALGYPAGYIAPDGKPRGGILSKGDLAGRSRLLAGILRAYPAEVSQRFRELSGERIEIEETVTHLPWTNEWGESGQEIAPLAPLLAFASKFAHYPIQLPDELLDSGWNTKYGPYTFVKGNKIRYTLPVASLQTRLYPAPVDLDATTAHVAEQIVRVPVSKKNPYSLDSLSGFGSWSSSSLALPLMEASGRDAFLSAWKERLKIVLGANNYYLRREPFSGARYVVSFAWREQQTDTLADVNSGLGAALYGLYSYARSSGDWDFVSKHWEAVRAIMEYFVVYHDWNNMQSGAREHNGSSAIDMDCIGFQGVLAYAEMARLLDRPDEAAWGHFLLSRLSVSLSMRWHGNLWINPQLKPREYDSVGVGLSEFTGFDLLSSKLGADHVNGELALTLAWLGEFPEVYDAQLHGVGETFFKWLEYDYVEGKIPDWRMDHPGNRNNHPANVSAHLYLRALLGASASELREELTRQKSWGLSPRDIVAQENAPLYALLAAREFPVILRGWDRAVIEAWHYDMSTRTASLRVRSEGNDQLTFTVLNPPSSVQINKAPVSLTQSSDLRLSIPSGETTITLTF